MRSLLTLVATLIFLTGSAWAQLTAQVTATRVDVRSDPSSKSEVLLSLKKGQSVRLVSRKGDWQEVQVQAGKGFTFSGWVPVKALNRVMKAKAPTAVPAPSKPAPVPTARPTIASPQAVPGGPRTVTGYIANDGVGLKSQPTTESLPILRMAKNQTVDVLGQRAGWLQVKVFSADTGKTLTGWVEKKHLSWKPVTGGKVRTAQPAPRSPTEAPSRESEEGSSTDFLGNRLSLRIGPGVAFYSYKLESSNGTAPADFNIFGVNIDALVHYWFWKSADSKFLAGLGLQYQHAMFFHKTNVSDSTGTLIDTQSKSSSLDEIWPKVWFAYQPGSEWEAFRVGMSLGYQILMFKGDDVLASGAPLNLFVSQTTKAITTGVGARFAVSEAKRIAVEVQGDVFLLSSVSEDPANASGTDPKGKIGFSPTLRLAWEPGSHHRVGFDYTLRMQNYSFTGNGSRVGTNNVTDSSAKTMLHQAVFNYAYNF